MIFITAEYLVWLALVVGFTALCIYFQQFRKLK